MRVEEVKELLKSDRGEDSESLHSNMTDIEDKEHPRKKTIITKNRVIHIRKGESVAPKLATSQRKRELTAYQQLALKQEGAKNYDLSKSFSKTPAPIKLAT